MHLCSFDIYILVKLEAENLYYIYCNIISVPLKWDEFKY